jgi:hypothetical protein
MAPVAVLSGLDDPDVLLLLAPAFLLLELRVVVEEELVLGVVHAANDVEGERECVEDVHLSFVVVGPHVVEEGLLVPDVEVLLQVVMYHQSGTVLDSLDSLASQKPCPLQVRPLVYHHLVLAVPAQVVPPVPQVDRVEDAGV